MRPTSDSKSETDRKVSALRDKLGSEGMLAAVSGARESCSSIPDAVALAYVIYFGKGTD